MVDGSLCKAYSPWSTSQKGLGRSLENDYGHKNARSALLFFYLTKKRHEQCSWATESFGNQLRSFIPSFSFTELGRSATISHVSLHDCFQLILSSFDCMEVVQAEDTLLFLNTTSNKG